MATQGRSLIWLVAMVAVVARDQGDMDAYVSWALEQGVEMSAFDVVRSKTREDDYVTTTTNGSLQFSH